MASLSSSLPNGPKGQELAQDSFTYFGSSSDSSKNESSPLGDFVIGLIMIGCAFPMVWFNERRCVRMGALIDKAKKSVKSVKVEDIDDGLDLELIHAKGKLDGPTNTIDERFKIEQEQ